MFTTRAPWTGGQPVIQPQPLVQGQREEPGRRRGQLADLLRRCTVAGELQEPDLVEGGAQLGEERLVERPVRAAGGIETQHRDGPGRPGNVITSIMPVIRVVGSSSESTIRAVRSYVSCF